MPSNYSSNGGLPDPVAPTDPEALPGDAAGSVPVRGEASSSAPLPIAGKFDAPGCACFLFGLLPLFGICAELVTGMMSEFHTLFPTTAHKAVVAAAVATNFVLHLRSDLLLRAPRLHAALLGFVSGMTLLYCAVEAAALREIVFAVFFAGLGILAAAPFWAACGLPRLWLQLLRMPTSVGLPQRLALAAAAGAAAVAWSVTHLPPRPEQATALQQLVLARRNGPGDDFDRLLTAARNEALAPQREACENGIGGYTTNWGNDPGLFWFQEPAAAERPEWIDPVELRAAYYLARGIDWQPAEPNLYAYDRGLRWTESRFAVEVAPDAALAVVDWHVEVRSNVARNQEADFAITLPPGGAATGLSLRIAGEERPAAFGSTERTERAFREVTAKQRDPALLTETGPGRLRLRLFPVSSSLPPMQARVRFVLPLELGNTENLLHMPAIAAGDLQPAKRAHTVTVRNGTEQLQGDWPDELLVKPLPIRRGAEVVACTDANGPLVQRLQPCGDDTPLQAAVIVVEASRSVAAALPRLSRVLDAFAPETACSVLVAHDERFASRSGRADDAGLRAWLDAMPRDGGVDPRPALVAASKLAAAGDGKVFWLHGECPRLADLWDGPQPPAVTIFATQLTTGAHLVRDEPQFARSVRDATAAGDVELRLAALAAFVRRGAGAEIFYATDAQVRTFERPTVRPDDAAAVDDHLARLWAAREARRLRDGGDAAGARALAASYRLVTAGVGAVVLETAAQFEAHGLDPGAPIGFEPPGSAGSAPIPEPGTLLLVTSGLLAAFGLQRRRRARPAE